MRDRTDPGRGHGAEPSPMSFKAFLTEQAEDISPAEAQKRYDMYVAEFMKRQPSEFFDEHKNAAWFRERYHPVAVRERQVRIQREVAVRAKEYARIWDARGPRTCYIDLRVDAPGEKCNDFAAVPGILSGKKEPGDVLVSLDAPKAKSESVVENGADVSPTEVVGAATSADGCAVPTSQDGDVKKEDEGVCVDSGVASSLNAEGSGPVTKMSDSSPVPQEDVLPLLREPVNDTVFLKAIPLSLPRAALEDVMSHGRNGDMHFLLVRFKFGEINAAKSLTRLAWAVYPDEATAKNAIAAVRGARVYSAAPYIRPDVTSASSSSGADGVDVDDEGASSAESVYVVQPTLNLHRKKRFPTGRILPGVAATEARIDRDAAQAEALMRCFDKMRLVDTSLQRLTPEFLASLGSNAERLDFCICYLREVHYFAYYSGNEYLEDPTSMLPSEVRPNVNTSSAAAVSIDAGARWERKLDDRIAFLLARRQDRPRSDADDGTALREEKLAKWLDSKTKFEAEGRYRCLLPPLKLFKGPEFVHKHIRSKHSGAVDEVLNDADEEQFRINFNLDPAKDELVESFLENQNSVPNEHGVLEPGSERAQTGGHNTGALQPENTWGNAGMPGGLPGGGMPLGPAFGRMPGAMPGVMQSGMPGGTPGMQGMIPMPPPGMMPMMMPANRLPGGGLSVGGMPGGGMPSGAMLGGGLPHGGMSANGGLPGGVGHGGGMFNASQMMPPAGGMFNQPRMMVNAPQNFVGGGYPSSAYGPPQPDYNEYSDFPGGGHMEEEGEPHGPDQGWSSGRVGDGGGSFRGGRGRARSRGRGRGGSGGDRRSREACRSRPLDPRARRPNNNYNDLDAPPAGPQIDAAYDDI